MFALIFWMVLFAVLRIGFIVAVVMFFIWLFKKIFKG